MARYWPITDVGEELATAAVAAAIDGAAGEGPDETADDGSGCTIAATGDFMPSQAAGNCADNRAARPVAAAIAIIVAVIATIIPAVIATIPAIIGITAVAVVSALIITALVVSALIISWVVALIVLAVILTVVIVVAIVLTILRSGGDRGKTGQGRGGSDQGQHESFHHRSPSWFQVSSGADEPDSLSMPCFYRSQRVRFLNGFVADCSACPSMLRRLSAMLSMRRLFALLIIALALLPTPFDTRRSPPINTSQRVTAVSILPARRQVGEVRVDEAWQLRSPNSLFGGASALSLEGPRQFLLAADTGTMMRIALDRSGVVRIARIWPLWLNSGAKTSKAERDLESLASDPGSGNLWAGFEQRHRIARYSAGMARLIAEYAPPAMQGWDANGGAEAMTRLPDGRFIVLAETSKGPEGGTAALVFPADPTAAPHPAPVRFALDAGDRGRVTDAAPLPDGRVLLLFRKISLTQGWISTLAVADPTRIRPDQLWHARSIARFARPAITENFEGLAIEPQSRAGGPIAIWMVSDDNLAQWQRTLLLRVVWQPT